MALERSIYQEFEAVVGARNMSESPAVLETYRCAAAQSSAHYGPFNHRTPTPQAVILPGSTEEVSAVIRLCNKYGIKFKASTTFWSAHGYVDCDNAVQLDMRRMSDFEIDPKNMIMTIEPYVIAATAQAEAMKYGLTCCISGVGCSSSIVANTAGWLGGGPLSIFTGSPTDNFICAEWVLPDGEIVKTSSAGAGDGWFCGEGPGISQRAMFRGGRGTTSDMGICTRMSIKLSPWPGPDHIPSEGLAPAYRAVLPDNIRAYELCFSSWKDWAQAIMQICDAEIAYAGHRQFSMFGSDIKAAMLEILTDPDKQLCDIPALLEDRTIRKATESLRIDICVILAGMTEEDMVWKEAALTEILRQNGGWRDEWCLRPEMEQWLLMYFLRLGHKNLNYALCGAYEGHLGLMTPNLVRSAELCEQAYAFRREWEEKDDFMAAVGGDTAMGSISTIGGGAGTMPWEFFAHFDAHDKESIRKTKEFFDLSAKWQAEHGLGGDFSRSNANSRKENGYGFTQAEQNAIFANAPNKLPLIYQFKLREEFNPNHLASSYYAALDPDSLPESGRTAAGRHR